ncbi:MAG TPA: hypothetical protein VGJ13_18360 [Pseudonocardiaceae bacterium]
MVDVTGSVELPGIRLGVVRGISYGLFGKPDEFVPQARALGAGLVRSYVYWGQVEPQPGRYVWDPVDALLEQLDGDEEVWITVCSSSSWATRQPTDFLPPSPAHDLDAYGEFVRHLVRHCAGRVKYWQCDNEPSNIGLLWAGTAEEYVAQLTTMHRAVKDADPAAVVVLGGCGYDVFSSDEGSAPRQFFDHLVSAGRDGFDAFSVHLYGDPTDIPAYVDTARQLMRAHGYLKPILVGEYGGPVLFEFPELEAVIQEMMVSAFNDPPPTQSVDELKERAQQDPPERQAMVALYDRMPDLPPELQMFLTGCPPELEAKRHRINCRQVVMRNLLALAAGIRRTAYWNLAPEVPGAAADPYHMMHLMFGKLTLLDYEDQSLRHRHPAANTFELLTGHLAGVRQVTRIEVPDRPTLYAFHVDRADREPLLVLWEHRDPFTGEDDPPVTVSWPWQAPDATAIDALGNARHTEIRDGRLRLDLSLTPVFVTAGRATSHS